MNTILTKCIAELKNEAPRIDYVLGMLETLSEMQTPAPSMTMSMSVPQTVETQVATDASPILDAYASGPIGHLSS